MKYLQALNDIIRDAWLFFWDQQVAVRVSLGVMLIAGFLLGKI